VIEQNDDAPTGVIGFKAVGKVETALRPRVFPVGALNHALRWAAE
jgi:hypothetical protein